MTSFSALRPEGFSRREVRAVDRLAIERYGMDSLVLMENAGRGCADLLESLGISGPVAICCGKGNNGGDGFVIARHLLLRGHSVQVFYFDTPESMSADARANFEVLRRGAAPLWCIDGDRAREVGGLAEQLQEAAWIVDALLGTGAAGSPRFPYDEVIRIANVSPARRLAIDWPSGLDCDSGDPADPTFRADHTCTFVASKRGSIHRAAAAYVGTIHVCDIGVLPCVVEEALRSSAGT
jgi:NAD(P)H-hydrate epimerase